MRKLLFFVFASVAIAAVVLPLLYLIFASELPDLSSPARVMSALARTVEGERMANRAVGAGGKVTSFEVTPLEKLPRGMVVGLLAVEACPEFLEVEKEPPLPRFARVLQRSIDRRGGAPGPGRCLFRFADLIASAIGLVSPVHATIGLWRISDVLSPRELVEYRLASTWYATGLIGIDSAARHLFGKPAARLDLAESAELLIAEGQFDEVKTCKNPARLKRLRDNVLSQMESYGGITKAEAKRARARPLACSRR